MTTQLEEKSEEKVESDVTPLLSVEALDAGYDQSQILRGVNMVIPPNSVVSLLGRNGVGKTTTL